MSVDPILCAIHCGFSVHASCLEILSELTSCARDRFLCSDIIHQFRPNELSDFKLQRINITDLKEMCRKRGKVNTKKYCNQKRRWENEEMQCQYCKRWYDFSEVNHTALHCEAAAGSPITDENRSYFYANLKRFRHISWKVP